MVGPIVAQTVPKSTAYGDEVDKFLNAYVSNLKTPKEVKITVRATQKLIYVSKTGHQIIGLISLVIKSRHDTNILHMHVGRGHKTLKLKQKKKKTETAFDFVIFVLLATAAEGRIFTLP